MSAGRAGQSLPSGWGDEALQKAQEGKVGIRGIEKRTGDKKERSTLLRRLVITRHLTNKASFSFPLKRPSRAASGISSLTRSDSP